MSSNSPSFIGEYFIDESVCDKLIDFFNKTPDQPDRFIPGTNHKHWYSKLPGKVGTYDARIEKVIKDSIDLTFTVPIMYSQDISPEILPFHDILWLYLTELKVCMNKYAEDYPHSAEHLSQIQEGINLQKYQNKIYKAEVGKTIIWPTDFTHTHRGIASNTEHKYIMTGWYSFCRNFWKPKPLETDQLILDLGLPPLEIEIMA